MNKGALDAQLGGNIKEVLNFRRPAKEMSHLQRVGLHVQSCKQRRWFHLFFITCYFISEQQQFVYNYNSTQYRINDIPYIPWVLMLF